MRLDPLTVANIVGTVMIGIALIRAFRTKIAGTEEGRAVIVLLITTLCLSAGGLARRANLPFADDFFLFAWISVSAVGAWVILKPRATQGDTDTL